MQYIKRFVLRMCGINFAVIFVIPFVQDWPYKTSFSIVHFKTALLNEGLSEVYKTLL